VSDVVAKGPDRPPRSGTAALGWLIVAALAAVAIWQTTTHHGSPAAAPTPPSSSPASAAAAAPRLALPVPAGAPGPRPPARVSWTSLPVGAPLDTDFAVGRYVRSDGELRELGPGSQALTMDRAVGGPVLLVQDSGTVTLEQLRAGGRLAVLEAFPDEGRQPQGIAVDPAGAMVVYGLTSGSRDGRYGLVVRSLATGRVVESLRTRQPFAVRGWSAAGVLLGVTREPGAPPYVWQPGAGPPVLAVAAAPSGPDGPYLLAADHSGAAFAITYPRDGCTAAMSGPGLPAERSFCQAALAPPAAYSESSGRVVARRGTHGLWVLDARTGTLAALGTPAQAFVEQVAWRDARTVLAVITTVNESVSSVLRCRVGGGCERAPLPGGVSGSDLVLAG
jgi:hypothetical protein